MDRWAAGEVVDDVMSAALGRKTAAHVAPRFTSFPPYLMVQIKKCAPMPLSPCTSFARTPVSGQGRLFVQATSVALALVV